MSGLAETPWLIPDRTARMAARYDALQAAGQDAEALKAALAAGPRAPDRPDPAAVLAREIVPLDWYAFHRVPKGAVIRLENPAGAPGVAVMLWSAATPSERMNVHDSMKVQWTTRLGRGRMLLSDMGRPLASIADDTCGWHDALMGLGLPRGDDDSSPASQRLAVENMTLGALKLGLTRRDLHPCITFFAPVVARTDQSLHWEGAIPLEGTRVDLLAAVDLLVVASNTHHPLAPLRRAAGPVSLTIWQPADSALANWLRSLTPEAERAFSGWNSA